MQGTYYFYMIMDFFFHYVFSIQYLKAAINLPIIMDIFDRETETRLKNSKTTIRLLHICTTLLVTVCLIVQMSLINVTKSDQIFAWGILTLQLFSALILIMSICQLKRLIRRWNMTSLVMNERLMHIHSIFYLLFIGFYIMQNIANIVKGKAYYDEDPSDY